MFFKLKNIFPIVVLISFICSKLVYAEAPLKVVTSQAIYADIVKQIGGDKVEVKFVASPKFNVHFIQPRPSDVRNVTRADLVFYTGLDLEEWWGPLLEAAGKPEFLPGREKSVDLSRGIRLLEVPDHSLSRAEGDIHLFGNPHYNLNPENAVIMAGTVAEKLKTMDPINTDLYEKNKVDFISRLRTKTAEWKALCAKCRDEEIISYHKDIEYFADFLGLKSEQYLEPKAGIPPTPKHLQFLENYIKEKNIKAIVLPTYFPRGTAEALAEKTGTKVVTICQSAGELPGTENIFDFFDYNIKQISEALK